MIGRAFASALLQRPSPYCATVLLALAASTANAVQPSSLARLQHYHDPAYIGGLDHAGVTLAAELARDLGASIAATSTPCDAPDPRAGQRLRGGGNGEGDHFAQVPPGLRDLALLARDGTPEQRAVALFAIGLVGNGARAAAPFIESLRDPWSRTALSRVTCEQWTAGALARLVPPAAMPASHRENGCDAAVTTWLWRQSLDVQRTWPDDVLVSQWGELVQGCASPTIPADELAILRRRLDDTSVSLSRKAQWMEMLPPVGPRAASLADVLTLYAHAPDARVAFAAQRALVATGTEAGARVFVEWLDHGVSALAWRGTRQLAPHSRIVLPALERALDGADFGNRAAAAEAIGAFGDPAGVSILVRHALRSIDWPTAQAAVNALAGFAATDADAKAALREVASGYWSGRVREVARLALATGRGLEGDPFGCAQTPEQAQAREADARVGDKTGMSCIRICYGCTLDHRLAECGTEHRRRGTYAIADGRRMDIRWNMPKRQPLPRVSVEALSSWCASMGSTSTLRVGDDGWLVGCDGFENDGALAFVPAKGEARVVPIGEMGVVALLEWNHRYFAAGSSPLAFGDAGALYELVRRDASNWEAKAVAALPSVPTGAAGTPAGLAFADERGAVLFDPAADALLPFDCKR